MFSKINNIDPQTDKVFGELLFLNENTYIAGGYVRDLLLGYEPRDVDFIMTDIDYWDAVDLCEDLFEWAIPKGHKHGTFVFKDNDIEYEVTVCDSVEDKIYNRTDFVINAVVLDGKNNLITHDKFWVDCRDKYITEAKAGAIEEDKIRYLRGLRLEDKLSGFTFCYDGDVTPAEIINETSKYRRWNEIKKNLNNHQFMFWLWNNYPEGKNWSFAGFIRKLPDSLKNEVFELFGCSKKEWESIRGF